MQTLRIDLSEYRPYIQALQDRLNQDGVYTMSMTDAVKIAPLGGLPEGEICLG